MTRPVTVLVLALLSVSAADAGQVRRFAALPGGDVIADIAADADGFLYLAGSFPGGVFVAKLSPAGAELLYRTVLPGTRGDGARAVAADHAGAAYVAFVTSSRALATPGAHQRIFGAEGYQTLLAKLDPAGEIVYATYIGGRSNTSPSDVTVDAAGAAYVTGRSSGAGFPTTPGAAVASDDDDAGYLAKIDPSGSELLIGVRGLGLGPVAVDGGGAIYVAGSTYGNEPAPITPGAFQLDHEHRACRGSGIVGIGCRYGYVAKLSADGTEVLWGTYVTGDHGSRIADLSVDDKGRALIAGTTNSRNFPTTEGALLPDHVADKPRPLRIGPRPSIHPPPSAGFVAQLNADGTDLIFSTYFSGTVQETVTGMVRGEESIFLTGAVESPDLPRLDAPEACLPAGYVAEIALDGSEVLRTTLLERGASPALTAAGDLLVADHEELLAVDLDAAPARIACVREAASLERADDAAPGSLLSLFGNFLVQEPLVGAPELDGRLPTILLGMSVLVGDRAAPLLYVSPEQINLQVPFEAEPGTEAVLRDIYATAVDEGFVADQPRPLAIVERRPAVFLSATQEFYCPELQPQTFLDSRGVNPLAFDEGGRPIHCGNPARQGSEVTIFLAGAGRNDPPLETGRVTGRPPTPLSTPITLDEDGAITILAAESLPGSVGGVWRVRFRVPGGDIGHTLQLEPAIDGAPVGPGPLFLWVNWTED